VTYGMANAGFWGATRGIGLGMYLSLLLQDSPDEEVVLGLGTAGSLVGGLAMYDWARRTRMSAGTAHTIGNHGDYGHLWALSALLIAQPESDRLLAATVLAGSAAGLVLGVQRADRLPYTWGDAEVQRGAFLLGLFNAGAVWHLMTGADPSDDQARILGGMMLGSSAAFLYLADRLLVGHDFTAGQGIMVNLGGLAGGLLGAGVGVLVGPEAADDARPILALAALGANLGYAVVFRALSDDARRAADRRPAPLEIGFNPASLLGVRGGLPGVGAADGVALPLLTVRYRF
jgi:hypothetical protein